jgi:2-hydroxy-4-carboxymuconate semialdehyde hemiacetal dehydrogenase
MKICLAGAGAFGVKHLESIARIDGAEVVSLVGRVESATRKVAERFGIGHVTTNLAESLARPDIDAVILCTPTQLHASQAIACLRAGKHVQVEIPMADTLADAQELVRLQQSSGLVAMAGHTRRYNPSHQWLHAKLRSGELKLQQLNVQTYFFRRTNMNALGQPRSWTDHLLWHHAAHTIDLFQYQTGETASRAHAVQGPIHPELGIAMDMGIIMKAPSGPVCTFSLSFNNDGPLGTIFRYICDKGTYVCSYDDLFDGHGKQIDLSTFAASNNGIELQDREFIAAIREGREPLTSVARVLPAYRTMDRLERELAGSE